MKRLISILLFLLITSCSSKTDRNYLPVDANNPTVTTKTIAQLSAVYYTHGQAELDLKDLQAYPEIVVVQSFDEFKRYANQKIALWIDKGATPLTPEQQEWMNQPPQVYYPTVFVGSSDTLHSFRDLLGLCCFLGPSPDSSVSATPGFSVIQRQELTDPASPTVSFIQGYDQTVTVQAILEVTNRLLEGGMNATPSGSFIPPSTPTAVP